MGTVFNSVLCSAILVLAVIQITHALNCFICGDNNLEEFGECTDQFQYDCGTYARRFDANERIYCRTTRHKSVNNTYTIMKECISEQDHYKNFPKKSYPLDEECDLIDINGYEVAYCLCRHTDLCNEKSIADQFVSFEELHPELFSEMPTDGSSSIEQSSSTFPSVAFPSEIDLRRQPSNAQMQRNNDAARVSDIDISAPQIFIQPKDEISSHQKAHSSSTLAEQQEESNGQVLRCLQCGQGSLLDESVDCSQQIVVDCQRQLGDVNGGRSYCFSRQILLGPGQNAIEKMCVSEHTLLQELGTKEIVAGCGVSDNNRVRYCVCTGNECNRDSISSQMLLQSGINSLPSMPVLPSAASVNVPKQKSLHCQVCSEGNIANPTDCRQPLVMDCNEQTPEGQNSLCLSRQTQLSNGAFSFEKRCISQLEFKENFPDERSPMKVGCSSAFEGFVNYCICDTDLCNKGSLAEQGQMLGAKQSFLAAPTTARPVIQSSAAKIPLTTDNFAREVPPLIITHPSNGFTPVNSPPPPLSARTKSVKDRQERWKEFGNSASSPPIGSILVLLSLLVCF